jgi:hypothetical protein
LKRDFTSEPDNANHVPLVIFVLQNLCIVMIVLVPLPVWPELTD